MEKIMLTRRFLLTSVTMVVAALFFQGTPCRAQTAYMIGNSFSHNSELYSLSALAEQNSDKLTIGAHIKSGSPIHNIWGSPNNGREISPTFGKYRDALTKHTWDAVTLQPFYKRPMGKFPQSTMQTDIDSILLFIKLARTNPANKKTKVYLYASWPFLWTGKPFQKAWDANTVDALTTPTSHSRKYYEYLVTRMRARTDAEIFLIPIPEVMYELDKKMQAGKVPGFTGIGDIMGDKLHLDHGIGHYLAGVTVYATICRTNPTGLVKPDGHYDSKDKKPLTPQMTKLINTTVWDVVSKHAYTGVSPKSEKKPASR